MVAMQLYVWSPALNAPSIDPKCVVVESVLRLLKVDYTIVHANDPQTSPTGELPLLKDGSAWVAGVHRILNHLAKRNLDANESLSSEERAEYLAYATLIQERLYDCMLFTWYADTTNFVKTIRPTYANLLSFPSCYIVPIQLKKSATARLARYEVEIKSDDTGLPQNEIEEMKELQKTGWHHASVRFLMYRLARETYSILNHKLGEKDYMFGERATLLDCIAFGYLALHLYPELAHGRLQHILIHEYPRLAQFCDRFKTTYFSDEQAISQPAEDVPSFWRTIISNPRTIFNNVKDNIVSYMGEPEAEKKKTPAQIEFEKKRLWSITGGVMFLLAYVVYNGIVSIEFEDDDEYNEEEEYDSYEDEIDEL
ncbi:hypothetical protein EC973_004600 [Apophysomyces ossiformis]|uniref:Uncharacterized protein n=1 Tax=Apophysomyces ossiformis TaxID=679940 RepID=A0A8H7BXB8_9FUNG|nr:hypothetical protein EC973_004600 [Apophysomyces ossiformis]